METPSARTPTARTPDATVTPADHVLGSTLPVHPRRSGWRAGAAAALVAAAVADLRAGRSPAAAVRALADLGGYDGPRGLAGAEELDRRLAATDVRTSVTDVVSAFVRTLPASAAVGGPDPGEWVARSVGVVPQPGAAGTVAERVRSSVGGRSESGHDAVLAALWLGVVVLAARAAHAAAR